MTSDVEDPTTFYADLPSIFETDTSRPIAPSSSSYSTVVSDVNTEKSYKPIFGSFLFADSDPLSRAAFVASSSPSIEVPTTQERLMDNDALRQENNTSSSIQVTRSLVSPTDEPAETMHDDDNDDDDDDEDDFDGIPVRHASVIVKNKLNGDNQLSFNHANHDQIFDDFINHVENAHNDYELEDDSFLNGFTDEQHDTIAIVPTLFKDIPDIDDSNEHEEENDDGVPFDQMDMYNQSESIRSSSPDSLLSSSNLQDEQDDDINMDDHDDEVTHWNDDTILHSNSSNIHTQINRTNHPLILQMHPFDQVDFIDSSRSNSRCSHMSSHLSFGYNDQARIFHSDDELATPSDSDDDDDDDDNNNNNNIIINDDLHTINFDSNTLNHDDKIKLDSNLFNQDDNEDLCLQVNLDDHRSVSSFSKSNSTRSTSPIVNETPIINIDDDIDQSKTLQTVPLVSMDDEDEDCHRTESRTLQVAPIAALDDEDDDDLQTFLSDQPVLPITPSTIKNLLEVKHEQRTNDIVHDIINMRHLFDENNHDDEFIAIMHNPRIFEEVLYEHDNNNNNNNSNNNHHQKSDSIEQTNVVTSTFRSSSQLSIDNKVKNESLEHHQNIQQPSSLLELDNDKTSSSSSHALYRIATTTTTATSTANNASPAAVNYLSHDDNDSEKEKNSASVNAVNSTTDNLNIIQEKEQLQLQPRNTSNIAENQFINSTKYIRNMSTDNESDDDSELLKTLSQLHNIINVTTSIDEINRVEQQMSSNSSSINQERNSPELLSENIITNGNESELLNKKSRQNTHIILSSPYVIDTMKNSDEVKEEKDEKKNIIFHKNHNDDDDDDDDDGDGVDDGKQKEKYESREEEKKTTTFFSLTSTTSPTSFNNESHSTVVFVDPDICLSSTKILLSSNKLNDSPDLTNQLIADDLQISNITSNMDNLSNDDLIQQSTTMNLFDPFAPTTTTTTDMFDNILTDVKQLESAKPTISPSTTTSTHLLGNYNFDDLWNQSISQIEPSNNHEIKSDNEYDPNAFSWDMFLNSHTNNEKLNPFDDNTVVPPTDITWESLFGDTKKEDKTDLKDFLDWIISQLVNNEECHTQSENTFTTTQNLESIVKDIQMCSMPFDPIPSPPLHIDHSVANPLINATHHELFPINEIESSNLNAEEEEQQQQQQQQQQPQQQKSSMILYEDDEDQEENNELSSFNLELHKVVENLVSNILHIALEQVNQSNDQIDHFVDQILSQAIFEIYNEDIEAKTKSIENISTIINNNNNQDSTIANEKVNPFDEKFDENSIPHFQTATHTTDENKTTPDPWLSTTIEHQHHHVDPMAFFSNTFDESDLFSSISNPTKISEDDEAATLSEYIPPPILTDASHATMAANTMMKYTLTAPVIDDSGDDSSFQEDFFNLNKNESSIGTETKTNEEVIKTKTLPSTDENSFQVDGENNIFSHETRLLQFEAFASDQPLDSSEIELKYSNITAHIDKEFDESSQVQQSLANDNSPWISVDKTSETIQNDGKTKDEPWELEDTNDEKLTPGFIKVNQHSAAFNDDEISSIKTSNAQKNYFSDSFNESAIVNKHPNENKQQTSGKTVHIDDNDDEEEDKENIQIQTSLKDNINRSELSTSSSDSDVVKINDITPAFEMGNGRITDQMQTSFVNIDEADMKIDRPSESVEIKPRVVTVQSENEDLPPPLPSLPPLNDKSNTSNNNMPLKSAILSSNTNTQYIKKDLRSESEITSTVQPIVDTKVRSQTDIRTAYPFESDI